ncbi:hypothetical protein [Nocardia araoensis]|uniref:hypothetical protein n=1 Tax=Nocardia araoensis TaxID=228600 RepID=UPI0002F6BD6C|nr:hypothetical protein [Nocardia araoensis]
MQPLTPIHDPVRPSGVVPRIGAVVAFAFGLVFCLILANGVMELTTPHIEYGRRQTPREVALELLAPMAISTTMALLLLGGSIALFRRKRAGRIAVALGTGILTLVGLVGAGAGAGLGGDSRTSDLVFVGTVLFFSGTGLLCTVSPATRRWLADKRPRNRP